jgi:hypothetical protein
VGIFLFRGTTVFQILHKISSPEIGGSYAATLSDDRGYLDGCSVAHGLLPSTLAVFTERSPRRCRQRADLDA